MLKGVLCEMNDVMDIKHLTQFLLYSGSGKGSFLLSLCTSQGILEKHNQARQRERLILRLIIRNWLMQLWRLKCPKICSWQARNSGELRVYFQSKFEDLRTGIAHGMVPIQKPTGLKPKS